MIKRCVRNDELTNKETNNFNKIKEAENKSQTRTDKSVAFISKSHGSYPKV